MKILEMKVQALMLLVFGAMSVLNLKEPIKCNNFLSIYNDSDF